MRAMAVYLKEPADEGLAASAEERSTTYVYPSSPTAHRAVAYRTIRPTVPPALPICRASASKNRRAYSHKRAMRMSRDAAGRRSWSSIRLHLAKDSRFARA